MAARTRVGTAFTKRERDIDKWMKLMEKWGKNVRKNIQEIEEYLASKDKSYKKYTVQLRYQDTDRDSKDASDIY